jgi:hypothetical protein
MAFAGARPRMAIAAATLGLAMACGAQGQTVKLELEKAGWTLVTASEDTWVFMRVTERARSDGVRRVWTAYDSSTVRNRQGFAFRSVESLAEFDCRKKLSRIVEERFHDLPALKGQTWSQPNFVPTAWAPPAPGSIGAIRFAWACQSLSDT